MFAVIGTFSDTVQKDLPPVEEYTSVSVKCSGKPKCIPGNECKVEWKRGEGVKDSVQESERIAIDKEGEFSALFVTMNINDWIIVMFLLRGHKEN